MAGRARLSRGVERERTGAVCGAASVRPHFRRGSRSFRALPGHLERRTDRYLHLPGVVFSEGLQALADPVCIAGLTRGSPGMDSRVQLLRSRAADGNRFRVCAGCVTNGRRPRRVGACHVGACQLAVCDRGERFKRVGQTREGIEWLRGSLVVLVHGVNATSSRPASTATTRTGRSASGTRTETIRHLVFRSTWAGWVNEIEGGEADDVLCEPALPRTLRG